MEIRVSVCALWFIASLFVSCPCFGQTCGLLIHKDSFEITHVSSYNDPLISGVTDDGRNFTRITSTGLDWVDLSLTFNLSLNAVNKRLADTSYELYELRNARAHEVNDVLNVVYQLPFGEKAGAEFGMAFGTLK